MPRRKITSSPETAGAIPKEVGCPASNRSKQLGWLGDWQTSADEEVIKADQRVLVVDGGPPEVRLWLVGYGEFRSLDTRVPQIKVRYVSPMSSPSLLLVK